MEDMTLNNGVKMPMVGFGTYRVSSPEECGRSVAAALEAGYRMFDTAAYYGNEDLLGTALKESGFPRGDLFLATKVWFRSFHGGLCRQSVLDSMERLKVDYLDLVLLHWPFGDVYAAWRDLEALYREGRIRAIGVSNFYADRLVDLISFNEVAPAVNQVETNVLCQMREEHRWMEKYHVAHQAYTPLGRGRALTDPVLCAAAAAHGKSPAQTALRFLLQSGVSVIPKSSSPERIRENIDIFDFALSEEEMERLRALDTGVPVIGTANTPEKVETAVSW
ncbi:MAG: aldo/keto reductase [Desulfovibrionaceae bacterium]|nr:aldo/keto reductase [Desulfovibrionaceae bacterium]